MLKWSKCWPVACIQACWKTGRAWHSVLNAQSGFAKDERIPHHKKLLRAVQVGVRVLNNDRFATYDRLLELWYLGQVRV